jgi:hypothetical protein
LHDVRKQESEARVSGAVLIESEQLSRMKSLSQLEGTLSTTEPLSAVQFVPDGTEYVEFTLPNGWNAELGEKEGTFETSATIEMFGETYSLTKDAALQATSMIGLPRKYAMRTPGAMMAEHLNYWFSHGTAGQSFKLLHSDGKGLAFTKGSVVPVSNVKVLHKAVDLMCEKYGIIDNDIVVDFKYHHDLRFTQYRLVMTEPYASIYNEVTDTNDQWSYGLDVQNSLTASAPLRLRGYLFDWSNHGGCTSSHSTTGAYSRKGTPSEDDALQWLEDAFAGADDLKHEFDALPKLTTINLEGEINTALREIFEKYKVPKTVRQDVINGIYASEDLSMYGVLGAITEAANNPELTHQEVNRLLEIGGDLPGQATGRCKACHRLPVE